MTASSPLSHPLPSGAILPSLGGHFTYRVIGPCCRLFDREQLPWPCCRLQWRGKEPSWRRIGRRFTPDLAVQRSPSYAVEILEPGHAGETIILTVYSDRLTAEQRNWWYLKRKSQSQDSSIEPPGFPTEQRGWAAASRASTPVTEKDQATEKHQSDGAAPPEVSEESSTPKMVQCVLPLWTPARD